MKTTPRKRVPKSSTPQPAPFTAQDLRRLTERAEATQRTEHETRIAGQVAEVLAFCRPYGERALRQSEERHGELHPDAIARLEAEGVFVERRGALDYYRFRW